MKRGQAGSVLLQGTIALAFGLILAVGVLSALWRSFDRHMAVYQLALQAHRSLTENNDATSTLFRNKRDAVELRR